MNNSGKFVLFCIGVWLLAMLAGGSNTQNTFAPSPATGPNCYFKSDGYCAGLGSFYNALDAAETRRREGGR